MEPQAGKQSKPSFDLEPLAFSNAIRLSLRQWMIVGCYAVVLILAAPHIWQRLEAFDPGPDYRIPHDLSNDYWLYERYCRLTVPGCDTVLIGDSVVWGEFVKPDETLSHYLNGRPGHGRCANLGLDGAHPLALLGLVEHYAGAVRDKNVILQCNPLWLSSTTADLQEERASDFNHPRLVPQFTPKLPAYKAELSARLGVLVEKHVPFEGWTSHLQQAYYRTDIPGWTLDKQNAYENPLGPLSRELPQAEDSLRHLPEPWYRSGKTKDAFAWVDLETSLQWQAFQRIVEILQQRGNRLFVLVGPFNEHMLTADGQQRYHQVKSGIETWLRGRQVSYLVPPVLPSEHYGDASHPLAAGYAALARQLAERGPDGR